MSKSIQVSDEMYDFLINLSKEIREQDSRFTDMPYIFQVRETNEVPAHMGCGEETLYSSDYEIELRSDAEMIDFIKENVDRFIGTPYENEAKTVGLHTFRENLFDMLKEIGFWVYYVDKDYTFSNAFFTSKACDEYINTYKRHLSEPVNYLNHAHGNPELDMLFKFLLGLTDDEKYK